MGTSKQEPKFDFTIVGDPNIKVNPKLMNEQSSIYQQNEGEDTRKTNTARFTHLWIIENGAWKLKRVLSYDHQIP